MTSSMRCAVPVLSFFLSATYGLSVKTWVCDEGKCASKIIEEWSEPLQTLEVCKLKCLDKSGLWPAPTGATVVSKNLVPLNVFSIFTDIPSLYPEDTKNLLQGASDLFIERLQQKALNVTKEPGSGRSLLIVYSLTDPVPTSFVSDLDESYRLELTDSPTISQMFAVITSSNFFGARHALETLDQLIIYDEITDGQLIVDQAEIQDEPAYTFRAIFLDTARNYFSIDTIKRTIDVMSQNKLNTFHWHITDSHSFPYQSAKRPELSRLGAYSSKKIYTAEDIKDIVEFARVRGIRIIPEFNVPGRVGEGWQDYELYTTCFRWEPWTSYCRQPPCGQIDPTQDGAYDVLGDIYSEYAQLFDSDIFHMGGDGVDFNCWNATERIVNWMPQHNLTVDVNGFYQLWNIFQTKALERWRSTGQTGPVMFWVNQLAVGKYLDPKDYIIQIWLKKTDQVIAALINSKFRVVFSNYDEVYFDCGGGPTWVGEPAPNWCSPYIGWQTVYEHNPLKILHNLGINDTDPAVRSLVLGSEGALWTQEIDDLTIDYRYWPRAAALAERLWSNLDSTWKDAQYRYNNHRGRIVERGARAERAQPEWCYQNDGGCP